LVNLSVHSARREFRWLAALALACGVVSAVGAKDRLVWALEAAPVFLVAAFAWSPFVPSPMLARVMFLHAIVLLVGAHYTYAEVPAGHQVAAWLGQSRNPYDRLGHFMQGVTPALLLREWLVRGAWVRSVALASFLAVGLAEAFSACYELFEWAAATALGQGAEAFLGSQGYEWDTQADMACALLGATCAVLFLGRAHLRSLRPLADSPLLQPSHA